MAPTLFEIFTAYQHIFWKAIATVLFILFLVVVKKFVDNILDRIMQGFKIAARHRIYGLRIEEQYAKPARHFITLIFIIIAIVTLLGIWELADVFGSLILGAGVAAVVIGFAAQGMLSDLIGGIMIFFDHPFKIGEWIKVREIEGTVTDISFRSTRILSFDGEYVTIPNRKLSEEIITNKTRRSNLRVRVGIGIDFETDIGKATDIALKVIIAQDDVLDNPVPEVVVLDLGSSSVNLELRFWVSNLMKPNVIRLKSDIIHAVKKEFENNGIFIPFQHIELIHHK